MRIDQPTKLPYKKMDFTPSIQDGIDHKLSGSARTGSYGNLV